MRNDFAFTVFDVGVSDAIEKRVLSCERMKREKIFAGDMSRGRIAEVGGDGESALVELISQRVSG